MLKKTLDRLAERVRETRQTVADMAQSVGAPELVTSLIRPEHEMKKDPWANPRSVQSADPAENVTPAASEPPSAPAPAPAPEAAAEPAPAEPPAAMADATPEDQAMGARVQQLIDDMINPAIAAHGGFINLVNVKGQQVFITMGGGCQGCAASKMTLKAGVERMIREELPEVAEVIDLTEHSAGTNPYYAQ